VPAAVWCCGKKNGDPSKKIDPFLLGEDSLRPPRTFGACAYALKKCRLCGGARGEGVGRDGPTAYGGDRASTL
jgi:hypothetical protein